jgi:hypothetical protein
MTRLAKAAGRLGLTILAAASSVLLQQGSARGQDLIDVGNALISPGTSGSFPVDLLDRGAGSSIAGLQLDIAYDSVNTPVAANASGAPDCVVNTAIGKNATTFAFLPAGCSGSACNRVRAIVLDTGNVNPIPTDSRLFTCKANVTPQTPSGNYLLSVTEAYASGASGQLVPVSVADGFISVPIPSGC